MCVDPVLSVCERVELDELPRLAGSAGPRPPPIDPLAVVVEGCALEGDDVHGEDSGSVQRVATGQVAIEQGHEWQALQGFAVV